MITISYSNILVSPTERTFGKGLGTIFAEIRIMCRYTPFEPPQRQQFLIQRETRKRFQNYWSKNWDNH